MRSMISVCRNGWLTDRNDLPEYSDYGDNADRMRSIGQVFPVIFFLVAALVSLTTMTRMVEEQRTQIGTMKALGYASMRLHPNICCMPFLPQWRQYPGNSDRREDPALGYY